MSGKEKQAKEIMTENLAQALELIKVETDKYCRSYKTKSVPDFVIKQWCDIIIKSYKDGIND